MPIILRGIVVLLLVAPSFPWGQDVPPLRIEVVDPDGRPVADARVHRLPASRFAAGYQRLFVELERPPQRFEVVERLGVRSVTDGSGVVVVERPQKELEIAVEAPGLYACLATDGEEAPLRIVLLPDRQLEFLVLDAAGAPASGVEVVIVSPLASARFRVPDPIYSPGGCAWIGTTDEQGVARALHLKFIVERDSAIESFAALGIPVAKREFIPLDEDAPPREPIELRMPPTGRVVVEGPRQDWGELCIRRAPDLEIEPFGARSWSNYAPGRRRPRDGRAEFPHVEIGLKIQVQAWWLGLDEPISIIAAGPAQAGETSTIRIEEPEWLAKHATRSRIVVTENGAEVAIHLVALTAVRSDNSEYRLCFLPADGSFDHDRDFNLRYSTWRSFSSGSHAVEQTGERHFFATVSAKWVDRIGEAAGLEPARYVDRPIALDVKFAPREGSYAPGETVLVDLEIVNRSSETLRWWDGGTRHMAFPDSEFRFVGRRGDSELR